MNFSKSIVTIVSFIALTACEKTIHLGNGNDNSDAPADTPAQAQPSPNLINWAAVPAELDPKVVDTSFQTEGVSKIDLSLFEFERDGSVIYSNSIPSNSGLLKIYRVSKGYASWGRLTETKTDNNRLRLNDVGRYECSIRVQNGAITSLEGGCYVRVELYLPTGSTIEVYNKEELLTRRFIPITNSEFLDAIDHAVLPKDKIAVLNEFLNSYNAIQSRASLTSAQAGQTIEKFVWPDDKFQALSLLNSTISDRENIAQMIDNTFAYFDREKARGIAGI